MAPLIVLLSVFGLFLLIARLRGRSRSGAGGDARTTIRGGRIALAAMFVFTGTSHFFITEELIAMLPPSVPDRTLIVLATGVLEILGGVGLLLERTRRSAAWALAAFLVLVFPANVYSALHETGMGGHAAGPAYLLVRTPVQLIFLAWTIHFGAGGLSTFLTRDVRRTEEPHPRSVRSSR